MTRLPRSVHSRWKKWEISPARLCFQQVDSQRPCNCSQRCRALRLPQLTWFQQVDPERPQRSAAPSQGPECQKFSRREAPQNLPSHKCEAKITQRPSTRPMNPPVRDSPGTIEFARRWRIHRRPDSELILEGLLVRRPSESGKVKKTSDWRRRCS